jgi:HSP20 family protein
MNFLTRFERWDPFEELQTLRGRTDRLWAQLTQDKTPLADWAPKTDVIETTNDIVLRAELPGMNEKDVDIQIENGVLTIKGERTAERELEEKGYRRIERDYGTFFRSFTLPVNIDAEKAAATFANGLLEVQLPKKEGAKPKTIKVEPKKLLTKAA